MKLPRSWLIGLSLSWGLLTSADAASPCMKIVSEINADVNKYSPILEQQRLPWMDLKWLQTQLGSATPQRMAENRIQYEWQCGDTSVFLRVQTDQEGRLIDVHGMYSDETGAGLFSANLEKALVEGDTKSSSRTDSQSGPYAKLDRDTARITELANTYAAGLKACKPGSYEMLEPLDMKNRPLEYMHEKITIQGSLEGRCNLRNEVRFRANTYLKMKCSYSAESVRIITEIQLKKLAALPDHMADYHQYLQYTPEEKESLLNTDRECMSMHR
jgi:hypothetical protein